MDLENNPLLAEEHIGLAVVFGSPDDPQAGFKMNWPSLTSARRSRGSSTTRA